MQTVRVHIDLVFQTDADLQHVMEIMRKQAVPDGHKILGLVSEWKHIDLDTLPKFNEKAAICLHAYQGEGCNGR